MRGGLRGNGERSDGGDRGARYRIASSSTNEERHAEASRESDISIKIITNEYYSREHTHR